MLIPGTPVGAYELLAPVSAAGSSTLWQAQGPGGRATVKLLRDPKNPAARRAFDREIELLSAAQGPRVIPLLDSGELTDGTPYLVLGWTEGVSFDHSGLAGCSQDVLTVLRNALRAVGDLHMAGLVHGAIQPANLIVSKDGEVFVLDFGSAAKVGDLAYPSTSAPPDWSAPERLSGEPPDPRADVFSLARVLDAGLNDELLRSALDRKGAKEARALFAKSQDPSPLVRPRHAFDLASRLEFIVSESDQRERVRVPNRIRTGLLWLSIGLFSLNKWNHSSHKSRTDGAPAQEPNGVDPGPGSLANLAPPGDPAAPGVLAHLATGELDEGNLERAENLLQAATEAQLAFPEDSALRADLARGWWRLGRPLQAAKLLYGADIQEPELRGLGGILLLEFGLCEPAYAHLAASRKELASRTPSAPLLSDLWQTELLAQAQLAGPDFPAQLERREILATRATHEVTRLLAGAIWLEARGELAYSKQLAKAIQLLQPSNAPEDRRAHAHLQAYLDPEQALALLEPLGQAGWVLAADLHLLRVRSLEPADERGSRLRRQAAEALTRASPLLGKDSLRSIRGWTQLLAASRSSEDPAVGAIADQLAAALDAHQEEVSLALRVQLVVGEYDQAARHRAALELALVRAMLGEPELAHKRLPRPDQLDEIDQTGRAQAAVLARHLSSPEATEEAIQRAVRELHELADSGDELSAPLVHWLIAVLVNPPSVPSLRALQHGIEVLSAPDSPPAVRTVQALLVVPEAPLENQPPFRPIAAEAIRQTCRTLADPETRDIELASQLGQALLARRDFASIRELAGGFPLELPAAALDVQTVLSAFALSAGAPRDASDPAFLQLKELPPDSLHPIAVRLLQTWADRVQQDHGDAAALRWQSLAATLASGLQGD